MGSGRPGQRPAWAEAAAGWADAGDQAEPGEVLQGAAGLLPVGCRVAAGAPGNEFPGQLAGEDRPRYAVRV